jgi:anionic cell wall polymer biosynthesis LytR-Cps2A-Psr (LCP) family protein
MSGEVALEYARSRHSENDFARARRQQQVLLAIRERLLRPQVLGQVPSLLGIVQSSVSTDLSPKQLLELARLSTDVQRDKHRLLCG